MTLRFNEGRGLRIFENPDHPEENRVLDAGELHTDVAGGVVAWPGLYRAGLKDRLRAIKSHIAGGELDDRPPDPGRLLTDLRIRFA